MGLRKNFSSWMAGTFNSIMDGIASRMSATMNSMYSNVNNGGVHRPAKSSEYTNIYDVDPNLYYDILNDYPFFNKLAKGYSDSLYEVILKDDCKVIYSDKKLEEKMNKAIVDHKLKDFILARLKEMVKRGTYVGFIDNNASLNEIINPYDSTYVERHGRFLSAAIDKTELPFYDLIPYWYEKTITNELTVNEMKKIAARSNKNIIDEKLEDLNKDLNKESNQTAEIDEDKDKEIDEKQELIENFKNDIKVDTVIFKGKSIFEEYLRDLYKLFIREYIWDALSLSEYLKANIITATISAQKYDQRKVVDVINDVESLLNTDNINIIMAYSDPLQLLNLINDKIINKVRVLPQVSEYSSLDELKLPDIQATIDKLKNDIEEGKKHLEDCLNIPEDIVNGSGNRWEISSKYVDYTDTLSTMLDSISRMIKMFCSAYIYRTEKIYVDPGLIEHKFDINKFVSPYMNRSNLAILNDKMKDITGLLSTASDVLELPAVDGDKFIEFFKTEIKNADPGLEGLIKYDKKKLLKSESSNQENNQRGFFSRKNEKR